MKKIRFSALFISIVLLLSPLAGCASAGPAVAKVAGEAVTLKDVTMFANFILMEQGLTLDDITDPAELEQVWRDALDTAVLFRMLRKKAEEKKLYPLSSEDRKAEADNVSQYIKDETQALVEKYTQESSSDPNKDASRELNERMKKTGLTRQGLTELMVTQKAASLVVQELMKAVTVSEEDVKKSYDEKLAAQSQLFQADAAAYEQAVSEEQQYGVPVLYKPSGYRYVKHILVAFPEETAGKIQDAQMNGDDEAVKKLRDEALPGIRPRAEEALAKVNAGQDFDEVMAEYGEDPGMQSEPAMIEGYALGPATAFVEEFKQAALRLAKAGDVTGLVATDFGWHIIKWVGDVPHGPVPLDDVRDMLEAQLLQEKQEAYWDELVASLKAEYKVEEHPERIPALSAAPAASPSPVATPAQ